MVESLDNFAPTVKFLLSVHLVLRLCAQFPIQLIVLVLQILDLALQRCYFLHVSSKAVRDVSFLFLEFLEQLAILNLLLLPEVHLPP